MKLNFFFPYRRSNKTKSRSCPTRAVGENLSIRLSISGASERVRVTSTFGCQWIAAMKTAAMKFVMTAVRPYLRSLVIQLNVTPSTALETAHQLLNTSLLKRQVLVHSASRAVDLLPRRPNRAYVAPRIQKNLFRV